VWLLVLSGCRPPVTARLQQAEEWMWTHPDSSLQLLESLPNAHQLTGEAQARYALLLTQARYRCYQPATSDSLIRLAVDYYTQHEDLPRRFSCFLYLSDIYIELGRTQDAMLPLKQAEELIPVVQDERLHYLVFSRLAYMNKISGNYKLAYNYYHKALALSNKLDNVEWRLNTLMNILPLPIPEVIDTIETYIHEMLAEIQKVSPSLQSAIHNNIGRYRVDQGQLDEAIHHFHQSIAASPDKAYRSYMHLGKIYDALGLHQQTDSLFDIALRTPVWATRSRIFDHCYKRALSRNQFEEAAYYMQQYITAVDSFYYHNESDKIQSIQSLYDKEIVSRSKAEAERNLLFSILLILLLIIAFYFYLRWKSRHHQREIWQKTQRILTIEAEKHALQQTLDAEQCKNLSYRNELKAQIDQLETEASLLKQELRTMQKYATSLATVQDVQALNFWLRISQDFGNYHSTGPDYDCLLRWTNICSSHFATRLHQHYPMLSPKELSIACLFRLGCSVSQVAQAHHYTNPHSLNVIISRICVKMNIESSRASFTAHINSF